MKSYEMKKVIFDEPLCYNCLVRTTCIIRIKIRIAIWTKIIYRALVLKPYLQLLYKPKVEA